jgi:hypothetical protein
MYMVAMWWVINTEHVARRQIHHASQPTDAMQGWERPGQPSPERTFHPPSSSDLEMEENKRSFSRKKDLTREQSKRNISPCAQISQVTRKEEAGKVRVPRQEGRSCRPTCASCIQLHEFQNKSLLEVFCFIQQIDTTGRDKADATIRFFPEGDSEQGTLDARSIC